MNEKKGAKILVECLVKQGVKYIFGIPGAKIDAVFDALLDTDIKIILCRHEQNAAFMAAAYGRLTGRPGVAIVTSGPGVSNLVTGLLTATTEGDPMIAIGGNVPRSMKLKESHQSTDNIRLTEGATKISMEIPMIHNISEVIQNAFRIATEPRMGAVFISVPQDILTESSQVTIPDVMPMVKHGMATMDVIEKAAQILNDATSPVLLLGLEASRLQNAEAIRTLLKKWPLATIGTYQAAGVITRDLVDCFIGRVGLFKNQPGDKLIDAADVVLTIGFDPVEYDPEIWNAKGDKKIIHLDYNPVDIHTDYSPVLEVVGDIAENIKQLTPLLKKRDNLTISPLAKQLHQELLDFIAKGAKYQGKLMHPLRFIHDLRQTIDDDATIISDIGTHYMWLARYFFAYKAHHLLFSNGQQTLGVALPWAIATRLVRPDKPIISISGDGGFLFSSMELETAVREKIHFVHCVWCDGSYNMVLEQQLLKYHRTSAVHFGPVDLVKQAESYGAQGFRVTHSEEFIPILKNALTLKGPVIIEIPVDYSDNAALFKLTDERNIN